MNKYGINLASSKPVLTYWKVDLEALIEYMVSLIILDSTYMYKYSAT